MFYLFTYLLTYLLAYLHTYVIQLFVTCYVHTISSITLCVMQWMQLFLPCNEMPASGLCLLHFMYRGDD